MRAGGSEPWDLGMLHQALVSAATIGPTLRIAVLGLSGSYGRAV